MGQSFVMVQPLRGRNVTVGGGAGGPWRETPETVHYVNVVGTLDHRSDRLEKGEEIDVQLGLTTRQMAQIVIRFLWHDLQGIYRRFLQRLLVKRWATMTAPHYRNPQLFEDCYREMHYQDEIPA